MLNLTVFGQRWIEWAKDKMKGGGEIEDYGCLLCCSASVSKFLGKDTNPKLLNKQDIYNGKSNIIVWGKLSKALGVKSVVRYGSPYLHTYNNQAVLNSINKGLPVFVAVNASAIGGSKKTQHWVVFIGDKKSIDPWTGSVVPTSKWSPEGYALINK